VSARRSGGLAWALGAVGVVVTLVVLAAVGAGAGDRALDPRSHARLGTSALVALADELGADVSIADSVPDAGTPEDGPGGPGADVVLLLDDSLAEGPARDLRRWVDAGGTLVVVDPASRFTPVVSGEITGDGDPGDVFGPLVAPCGIGPLDGLGVEEVAPLHGGVLYEAPPGADACLEVPGGHDGWGDGAYIVAEPSELGTVVSVGGSGMFVNAGLADGANAAVVTALVAPQVGTDLVVLEPGPLAGAADSATGESLIGLVPAGVERLLIQLGIAFVLYVLWRARRFGAAVSEPRPVAVAASELVAATGSLLDRAGAHPHAAATLRTDLHHRLAEHLGVPYTTPPAALAAVAGERTGADPHRVLAALEGPRVTDDAGLVALAHTIDRVREEVLDHV
jgi:hypothetical protein